MREEGLFEGYAALWRNAMSTQPDTNDIITNDVTTNDSSTSNKNNTLSRRDFLKYSSGANDVLPLDDLVDEVKKNGQYNDYLPGVFAPMLYKGHTITWPWAIDIRIPFYRTDLFQQAGVQVPTTWDEWRAAAKKLSGNVKDGIVDSGADNLTEHMLETLMINNCGGVFTPDQKLDFSTRPLNIYST